MVVYTLSQIFGALNRYITQRPGPNNACWLNNQEQETKRDDQDDEFEAEFYTPTNLKVVIILSGKRKSGKDHISTLITNYIGHQRVHQMAILRIAGPIKREYAEHNRLNFSRLLDSSSYKENFRSAMVEWSEKYREEKGWDCFLKRAIKEQRAKDKLIWVLNDARRPCDVQFFENDPVFSEAKILKLRIEATDVARMSRGWKFTPGIDDKPTECGLDDYTDWSHVLNNNYNEENQLLQSQLRPIFEEIDRVFQEENH